MKTIMVIISLFFFLKNEIKQDHPVSNKLVEKTFKAWNEKTLTSIKDQLIKANNSGIKSTLQNRLDVLQLSLYSPTANKNGMVDRGKPLRYKFLQAIYANKEMGKNIFIVETESEGEVLQLRNYLIENEIGNSSHVIVYSYFENDWTKVRDTMISKVDLHSELKITNNEINKLSENNRSDVILSEFDSLNMVSHYYIPLSIEKNNVISKILKL